MGEELNLSNLLPENGEVYYYGKVFDEKEAFHYFSQLIENINWSNDEVVIFGKKIITKRKVAWYGDNGIQYRYSNSLKIAISWTKELLELKTIIEKLTDEKYNSCLLNLYHSGEEGISWHSDNEREMKKNGAICSLSFGAERRFVFKHNSTKEKVEIMLENGSVLVMKGETQNYWKHSLLKTKKVLEPRINLTFRTIIM